MLLLLPIVVVVALVVIAVLVVGLIAKLLWWILLGLLIGGLARLVLPGRQALGLLRTVLAGVGGALLGGIVAHSVLHVGSLLQFVLSVAAAALLVGVLARGR
jgi:uncharacterized membrane protein YeaQ/YmgE (transglycosylase-associated protein family)